MNKHENKNEWKTIGKLKIVHMEHFPSKICHFVTLIKDWQIKFVHKIEVLILYYTTYFFQIQKKT